MDSILELQYIMSTIVTFEDCKFENNSGQCLQQDTVTICETHIKRCIFNNNHGGSGCAIYSASGGHGIYITIEDCIFSNNNVTSNWSPLGGAIYTTTSSIKFEGIDQFINNEVNYENSERFIPSFYQGECGGLIYIIQSISSKIILNKKLKKFSFSTYGGSFCSTIEGTINIEQCKFFKCRADNGGDIYCTDESRETPSTLTVTNYIFNNSLGRQHGSDIYITSNSFQLSEFIFDNMVEYSSVIYADLVGENVAQKVIKCNFTHCDQQIIFKSGI